MTDGTDSSMSGNVLMNVRVSSGKVVDDLYAAAEPSPAQQPGLKQTHIPSAVCCRGNRREAGALRPCLFIVVDDCAEQQQQGQRHTCPSPGLWDLLVRDGRPHRLAVSLLFEFTTKSLLYVVHVEGTDG